jgi:hypothetical protein
MHRAVGIFFVSLTAVLWLEGCGAGAGTRTGCVRKSDEDWLLDVRDAFGCKEARPSACTCDARGNQQKEYPCEFAGPPSVTLWDSTDKSCVEAHPDMNANFDTHPWSYPANYGDSCAVHPEPGSYDCTKTAETSARLEFNQPVGAHNPATDSAEWCTQVWCYVDPCECNAGDMVPSLWFPPTKTGRPLFFSYAVCGAESERVTHLCAAQTPQSCGTDNHCKWVGE